MGDNATLSNAGALGEAVDDCDEFLVAVPVTRVGLDEVCGSSNDCAPSASCQSPTCGEWSHHIGLRSY
jgi:hypothetical protein